MKQSICSKLNEIGNNKGQLCSVFAGENNTHCFFHSEKNNTIKADDMCPICHESDKIDYQMSCCKKFFHTKCLQKYQSNNGTTCPNCRSKMNVDRTSHTYKIHNFKIKFEEFDKCMTMKYDEVRLMNLIDRTYKNRLAIIDDNYKKQLAKIEKDYQTSKASLDNDKKSWDESVPKKIQEIEKSLKERYNTYQQLKAISCFDDIDKDILHASNTILDKFIDKPFITLKISSASLITGQTYNESDASEDDDDE
jgi:hypothetical protein